MNHEAIVGGDDAAVRVRPTESPDTNITRARPFDLHRIYPRHPIEKYLGVPVQVPTRVVKARVERLDDARPLEDAAEQVRAVDPNARQAAMRVVRGAKPAPGLLEHELAAQRMDSGVGI